MLAVVTDGVHGFDGKSCVQRLRHVDIAHRCGAEIRDSAGIAPIVSGS